MSCYFLLSCWLDLSISLLSILLCLIGWFCIDSFLFPVFLYDASLITHSYTLLCLCFLDSLWSFTKYLLYLLFLYIFLLLRLALNLLLLLSLALRDNSINHCHWGVVSADWLHLLPGQSPLSLYFFSNSSIINEIS